MVLLLALVGATGAFWLSMQRNLPRDPNFGPVALPGLAGELPNVDRITLSAADGSHVTLVRAGTSFGVGEFANYPADRHRVHELLTALADLHLASGDGRRAIDETHAVTVDLAGRLSERRLLIAPAPGPEIVYVRLAGSATVGIAGPPPPIDTDPHHWLASPLIDIGAAQLSRIGYHVDTAAPLELVRDAPEAPFALGGSRPGTTVSPLLATAEPDLGAGLEVVGARPRAPAPFAPMTTLETFAGLRVEFSGRQEAAHHWLSLEARLVPPHHAPADDVERAKRLADRLNAIGSAYEIEISAERFAALFPSAE